MKKERLSWTIAIVGLIASLISIFAFLTGAGSLPSIVKSQQPVPNATSPAQVAKPQEAQQPNKATPGDAIVAPIKNGVNWAAGRLKPRHHATDPQSAPAQPTPDK